MAYDPRDIVLVNFGDYLEMAGKLDREPFSAAEIPLRHYKGFSYVAGYLSKPEETKSSRFKISDGGLEYEISGENLEHVRAVADAFRKLRVNVKCEGEWGHCNERATHLMLPYEIDCNREEKKTRGAPESVNQTYILQSSFCCKDCGEEMAYQKRGKVLELEISFRLPYILIGKERRNWNVDREMLHRKIKRIYYQLKDHAIDELIDPRSIEKETTGKRAGKNKIMVIDRYDAQRIVSRLLGCKEDDIPTDEEYHEPRELGLPLVKALPAEDRWNSLYLLLKEQEGKKRRPPARDDSRQLRLALSD